MSEVFQEKEGDDDNFGVIISAERAEWDKGVLKLFMQSVHKLAKAYRITVKFKKGRAED